MKALTIAQPYADLIARGEKVIENRTWFTPYRGPLVIHAGKSKEWLESDDDRQGLVFGAVVAVADLYDCRRVEDLPPALMDNEHANGPWCWLLRNIRRVTPPIPHRGAQGLWYIAGGLVAAPAKEM